MLGWDQQSAYCDLHVAWHLMTSHMAGQALCLNVPRDTLEAAWLSPTHPQGHNLDFCHILLVEAGTDPSRSKTRHLGPHLL